MLAYRNIYYVDLQSRIQDNICLNEEVFVMGISINNQLIYGTRESGKDMNIYQIWRRDDLNYPVNMIDKFYNLIEVQSITEAVDMDERRGEAIFFN